MQIKFCNRCDKGKGNRSYGGYEIVPELGAGVHGVKMLSIEAIFVNTPLKFGLFKKGKACHLWEQGIDRNPNETDL